MGAPTQGVVVVQDKAT